MTGIQVSISAKVLIHGKKNKNTCLDRIAQSQLISTHERLLTLENTDKEWQDYKLEQPLSFHTHIVYVGLYVYVCCIFKEYT